MQYRVGDFVVGSKKIRVGIATIVIWKLKNSIWEPIGKLPSGVGYFKIRNNLTKFLAARIGNNNIKTIGRKKGAWANAGAKIELNQNVITRKIWFGGLDEISKR